MTAPSISRRALLASAASIVVSSVSANARIVTGAMPWSPSAANPPSPWRPGPWQFFTADEAATVEAAVDRLIPPDERGAGGKDAGCAVFIDRQLAGPYGQAEGLYMRPPFMAGAATQGNQSPDAPAALYRAGLRSLAEHVKANFAGASFAALSPQDQDSVLAGLEKGSIELKGVSSADFFNLLLQNTQEGYFADPIYGGNRDMAGWKLVGFPGTRYDYRDWVERHNEPYPLAPVAITGRPDWTVR
jgi:gluconate 2-dehydrogenase gamma chain